MIDYKKPYFTLFHALSDAVTAMEEQNYGIARELLLEAQQSSEELILEQKRNQDQAACC